MSSHSLTSKTTGVRRRPRSPQNDATLLYGATSVPEGGPYKRVRSGRIAKRGWKHVKTTRGRGPGKTRRHGIKIDILPDDVFLRVFDFCHTDESGYDWWHGLVHVCRRWRQLILVSPRRLDLQLLCTGRRSVKENLGCWPAIPIAICDDLSFDPVEQDNLFAALGHPDRVRSISLALMRSVLHKVVTMMQRPFPALTRLRLALKSSHWTLPILPDDGFLGGSASCLQEMRLTGIYFPALPSLLLSASNLIDLHLCNIPPTCILPEAMVRCLAATTRLENLSIRFCTIPYPRPVVLTQTVLLLVLPALTQFQFEGDYKYLEDLAAQIDCPRLKSLIVSYFNQLVDIHVSQLFRFIDRAEDLKLARFRRARVELSYQTGYIKLDSSQAEPRPCHLTLGFLVVCRWSNLQIQSMRQLLIQSSAMFTTVRHLSVAMPFGGLPSLGNVDSAEWPELFRQFPSVWSLYVGGQWLRSIDPVLDNLTKETVAKVFPALRFLNLDGRPTRSVRRFLATRKLSGCPVKIVKTREEFKILETLSETEDVGY